MVWERVANVIENEDADALKQMKHSMSSVMYRDILTPIEEDDVCMCACLGV